MSTSSSGGSLRAACIIPVRNGGETLKALLASLKKQTLSFDLFVIDSSSTDDSRSVAKVFGAHIQQIDVASFDHGGTRQRMVDRLSGHDLCIFLTQDVLLAGPNTLEALIAPFKDPAVAATYGRQLPHVEATPFAAFLRRFNYSACSRRQSLDTVSTLGMKTVFISNSFAAYRRSALQAVGGFPQGVILGEDAYAAARLILNGGQVAYVADAECVHSHNYTLIEEWRRYFDIGVFYGRECWIQRRFGGASGEGARFVREELRYLGIRHCYLWPLSIIRNVGKLFFYKLGQQEAHLPRWLKIRLSMHRRFW